MLFEALHELILTLGLCIQGIFVLLSSHLELSQLIGFLIADPLVAIEALEEDDPLDCFVVGFRIFKHVRSIGAEGGQGKAYLAKSLLGGDLVTEDGEDLLHEVRGLRILAFAVMDVLEDVLETLIHGAGAIGEEGGCGLLGGFGHCVLDHESSVGARGGQGNA